MIKTVLGSILFTVGVFVFINVVGDVLTPPGMSPQNTTAQSTTAQQAAPVAKPEPVTAQTEQIAPAPTTPQVVAGAALSGDPDKGKKVVRRTCMGCHTVAKGGKNRTGPNLWGIVGRNKATLTDFRYSTAMKIVGGTWTEADLTTFLASPRSFVPDTKMAFSGLKKAQDRIDAVAFLKTLAETN